MKNLERHIVRLIARHNCVIIPDVGAFLAYNVPAHYNIEEQTFMPPHRTLGFNPQVKVDDALLTAEYMSSHGLSFEAAAAMLRNDILSLRRTLSRKGYVRFGELGTFSMNINSEITFEPAANCIDDPENFGFEPLTIAQLHNIDERTITIKRRSLSKYIATVAAIILTFVFATPFSEQMMDRSTKASLGNFASSEQISMMQQLTSAAPQQIVSTQECEISPIYYSSTQTAKSSSALPCTTQQTNDAQQTLLDAETNKMANDAVQDNASCNSTIESDISTTQQEVDVQEPEKHYYIIVASSPNAENAKLAITELSRKLQTDYEVVVCGKRHRIAAASYVSEEEALNNLPTLQATFPDAWILNN